MRILDSFVQSSPRWWAARRGRVTASAFDRILTSVTAKPSAQQDDYIAELLADVVFQGPNYFSESLLNKPPNRAMLDGVSREPEARRFVAHDLDCNVQQCALIVHEGGILSASPDGLIVNGSGEIEAGLELKNPLLATHARYVMKPESLLNDYRPQVQGCLLISGLPQWELYSYCPPLPAVHLTVKPDEYTAKLTAELVFFMARYNKAMQTVLGYGLDTMLARLHPTDTYADVA